MKTLSRSNYLLNYIWRTTIVIEQKPSDIVAGKWVQKKTESLNFLRATFKSNCSATVVQKFIQKNKLIV